MTIWICRVYVENYLSHAILILSIILFVNVDHIFLVIIDLELVLFVCFDHKSCDSEVFENSLDP